jgi:hypothetical protein
MRARKIVRGAKAGLTEPERYAMADHVIDQLTQRRSMGAEEEAEQVPPHST